MAYPAGWPAPVATARMVVTAGRDTQAVSKNRIAMASEICKTLAFAVIWVYNLS